MIQRLNAPITVFSVYDHKKRSVHLGKVVFDGSEQEILKMGFHHTYRDGRTLFHVFSVSSKSLCFRLVLNTDNLSWKVEEIADDEVN